MLLLLCLLLLKDPLLLLGGEGGLVLLLLLLGLDEDLPFSDDGLAGAAVFVGGDVLCRYGEGCCGAAEHDLGVYVCEMGPVNFCFCSARPFLPAVLVDRRCAMRQGGFKGASK